MMNYTMIDMLAEDVNAPEIANPMRWSVRPAMRKHIAKAAKAASAAMALLTALFVR